MGEKSLFMDPELWVLLHEKLPRELSWSESERELASAQEISLKLQLLRELQIMKIFFFTEKRNLLF